MLRSELHALKHKTNAHLFIMGNFVQMITPLFYQLHIILVGKQDKYEM